MPPSIGADRPCIRSGEGNDAILANDNKNEQGKVVELLVCGLFKNA